MRTLLTIKTRFSKAIPAEQGDGKRQSEIRALDTVTDSGVRGGICMSMGSIISILYRRQDPYFFEKLSSFPGPTGCDDSFHFFARDTVPIWHSSVTGKNNGRVLEAGTGTQLSTLELTWPFMEESHTSIWGFSSLSLSCKQILISLLHGEEIPSFHVGISKLSWVKLISLPDSSNLDHLIRSRFSSPSSLNGPEPQMHFSKCHTLLPARPVLRNFNHNFKTEMVGNLLHGINFAPVFRLGYVQLRKSYQINWNSFFDVTTSSSLKKKCPKASQLHTQVTLFYHNRYFSLKNKTKD